MEMESWNIVPYIAELPSGCNSGKNMHTFKVMITKSNIYSMWGKCIDIYSYSLAPELYPFPSSQQFCNSIKILVRIWKVARATLQMPYMLITLQIWVHISDWVDNSGEVIMMLVTTYETFWFEFKESDWRSGTYSIYSYFIHGQVMKCALHHASDMLCSFTIANVIT